ncbi:hypothetical protein [Rufibacter roseus]|uniref:Uncharacterized protein n=1 Tax=Rufibacter roseus TaxID=1567108 RepID=A0ABW2DHG0_9BACT|nr:hypothetical protein [Rufibacter roseus]
MKLKIKFLLFVFLPFGLTALKCGTQSSNLINKLSIKNEQLINIVDSIQMVAQQGTFVPVKTVYLIKINREGNQYEVSFALFEKSTFGTYLSNKKDKPLGYFNSNNSNVFVFGEILEPFFKVETGKSKQFQCFAEAKNDSINYPLKQSLLKNKNTPPMPPVVIGRIVWVYRYEDGKLKFVDQGSFPMLE